MRASSLAVLVFLTASVDAFVPSKIVRRVMSLNLEDHIANMIDGEVDRLNHKQEIENARVQRQREWAKMEPSIPKGFDFEEGFTLETTSFDRDRVSGSVPGFSGMSGVSKVQRRKDEKMANDDPARYCADRCVSTGNCDVFEDMFELDPSEVIKFCKECVLSEDEEPCDIPGGFYVKEEGGLKP
ncbi:hypothetical protein ACHAXN_010703 [Cyclotella atomus]